MPAPRADQPRRQRGRPAVSSASEIEANFRDAFEDVALLIGGTPSLHGREDQVVRTPMRRLGGVRSRVLSGSGGRLPLSLGLRTTFPPPLRTASSASPAGVGRPSASAKPRERRSYSRCSVVACTAAS